MSEEELVRTDWNRTAKKWIVACKIVVVVFISLLIITLTFQFVDLPYSIFLIGIELALNVMAVFMVVKMSASTRRRHRKYKD